MAGIFISYRREDSGGHAGRLCDRLSARFGADRVFMDIEDIRPGQNFAQSIEDTIARCDCVIAVIGPRWTETLTRRAGAGDDFVRHEVAAALRRGVTLMPVLVGGAHMPARESLPEELAGLTLRNAIEIRDERFHADVAQLEAALAAQIPDVEGPERRKRLTRAAVAVFVVVTAVSAAGAIWWSHRPPDVDVETIPRAVDLDGEWVAEMQKSGMPPFRIRLRFQHLGSAIGGSVQYPTGDGVMHDVRLDGSSLTFYTSHVPQFETVPAVIRFQAELVGSEIRLMSTDDTGVANGVARRTAPPPRP